MPYTYLPDVSLADVAFEATGQTLAEMFESAGLAVTNTMVKDLGTVKTGATKKIALEAETLDRLLFDFLQEFVYWKDKSLLIFSKIKVKIDEPTKRNKNYFLTASLSGEKISMKKHEMLVDVKAITWHLFKVEHSATRGWKCHVILDV